MSNAYPLHWPAGWPRTPIATRSKFAVRTTHQAVTELTEELGRLKASGIVLSSNVTLGAGQPKDKGVCVYFILKGKPYALPCDKWDRVEDNLWALAKHIEALRGQERWGVGSVERAFAGYMALTDGKRHWRDVFNLPRGFNPTPATVATRYAELAKKFHPDTGGSHDQMTELNTARDQAKAEGFL